jgi:hypothetical protein
VFLAEVTSNCNNPSGVLEASPLTSEAIQVAVFWIGEKAICGVLPHLLPSSPLPSVSDFLLESQEMV